MSIFVCEFKNSDKSIKMTDAKIAEVNAKIKEREATLDELPSLKNSIQDIEKTETTI